MKNHSVLVPVDGSPFAERALEVADTLLQGRESAQLTLLRALETPRLSAWLPAEMLPIYQKEREMVTAYLAEKEQQYSDRGYQIRTLLAEGPGPVETTITECAEGRVGLVVMSSHGQSGWMDYFLGSNAEKIMRLCPAQIFVVKNPPEQPVTSSANTILIPLDGSDRAEQAIAHALDLARGRDVRFILQGVSVVFQGHAFENDLKNVVEPDLKRVEQYLEEQAAWMRNQGFTVDIVVKRGQPADQILEVAKTEEVDLIVMHSKGRTGLAVWLYGSVAERVLRHSHCSILVLKELERK